MCIQKGNTTKRIRSTFLCHSKPLYKFVNRGIVSQKKLDKKLDLIFPSKRAIRESGDRTTQNKRNILSGLLCSKASLKGPFRNLRLDISGSAPALIPASAFKYKQCFYPQKISFRTKTYFNILLSNVPFSVELPPSDWRPATLLGKEWERYLPFLVK